MVSWFLKLALRTVAGALIASTLFMSAGKAELTAVQLQNYQQQFLANPATFLASNFTNGGEDLAAIIKAIAADPANLQIILDALASANPSQQTAMGSGLGQAAVAALATDPDYANRIQLAVAGLNMPQVQAGYNAATAGTQIGSTSGGGGGGGGPTGQGSGPPSGGGGGGGSSGGGGTATTGTAAQNLLTGGGVGSFGALSGSVSP